MNDKQTIFIRIQPTKEQEELYNKELEHGKLIKEKKEAWKKWRSREGTVAQYNDARARLHGYRTNGVYANRARLQIMKEISNGDIKCACCGERHIEFLTIDHIKNNGSEEVRKAGGHHRDLYNNMVKNGYVKENYQVLCMNCNFALGHSGYCPHNPDIKRKVKGGKEPSEERPILISKAPVRTPKLTLYNLCIG